ncbi:MAG: lactate utilization protein C [Sporichthyaceae bacterium]
MTSDAREEILARIRNALASAPPKVTAEIPRAYARSRPHPDLVGHFAERVADYGAEVVRVTAADVPAAIAAACERYGLRTLVTAADAPAEWTATLDGVTVTRDGDPETLTTADLDGVDGALTGAAVGIAETGTFVLDGGAQQGRRALSLVPDVLVCVVRTEQVVDDVPAAVQRLTADRPLTWISGPSATSDIELDRVEGVHGPRTLHVLVVAA